MRLDYILLAAFSFSASQVWGQELKKEYQAHVITLIAALKANKIEKIADLVRYPLKRNYPIPDVKDKEDFISRFNEMFNDTLKQKILGSKAATDWSEVGWRGIMLYRGDLWMDTDGKITAINYQSRREKERKNRLIDKEKAELHPSLVQFKEPVYILETSKFRIRIDELHQGNYRYASWPIAKPMSEKPDLVLTNGSFQFDGSGGNHNIKFTNGHYAYECYITVLGEEGSDAAQLIVTKGEKVILEQTAKLVGR